MQLLDLHAVLPEPAPQDVPVAELVGRFVAQQNQGDIAGLAADLRQALEYGIDADLLQARPVCRIELLGICDAG